MRSRILLGQPSKNTAQKCRLWLAVDASEEVSIVLLCCSIWKLFHKCWHYIPILHLQALLPLFVFPSPLFFFWRPWDSEGKATVGRCRVWWQRYEWNWRHPFSRSLRKWLQQCCRSFCVIHEYSDGSSALELSEQTVILSMESHCNLWLSIVE